MSVERALYVTPTLRLVPLDELTKEQRVAADSIRRNALLRVLHPDGYRDLRAFQRGEKPFAISLSAENLTSVGEMVEAEGGADLYFGVAPRIDAKGRGIDHCVALHCLFVDIDFKHTPEADARACLAAFPLPASAVVHSGGGLHGYWLLTEPFDLREDGASSRTKASRARVILRALATAVGGDLASAEAARILRMPGSLNHKYDPPRPVVLEYVDVGRRYALDDVLAVLPEITDDSEVSERRVLPNVVQAGGRNDTLFREGCRLRRLGWSATEIAKALLAVNDERCRPPLDAREVDTIAGSCARHDPAEDVFPSTETGDAEFFAGCNADLVRFDHRRGRWHLFDGQRWAPQTSGEVNRLAREAIRARQSAAVRITDDDTRRRERLKWATSGEARSRQTNMLALAQSIRPVADAGNAWDADPWLLGVSNGVVDLRTGTLRPGRPEDRITLQARAPFDPAAPCELWDRTISEIFGGDEELISYIDRYVGYSLTGDCREETLAFCWGSGANGKGTLMNTIGWLLGDYADDLPFSALELHDRSGIPNDIAKIVGKRFVTSSETGETKRLNEARIKALTGRDPITARFLHREFFTFQPVAKFWLATNQKPIVRDTSVGFWRRIHLIPFTRSFANDPNLQLKDRLRAEGTGILARAVRGCLAWQREGLKPPAVVREATATYRADSAPLARFLDSRCLLRDDARATFGALFGAYLKWCTEARELTRLTRREFSDALHAQFQTDPTSKRNVTFVGIGLLDLFADGGDL